MYGMSNIITTTLLQANLCLIQTNGNEDGIGTACMPSEIASALKRSQAPSTKL
jgi:hypothetical protein